MRKIILSIIMIWGGVVFGVGFVESGYLRDDVGLPVSGNVPMQFSIYDCPTGGSPLWGSGQKTVSVAEGLYQVTVADDAATVVGTLSPTGSYYLEQIVNDQTLSPRKILGTPFFSVHAVHAGIADQVSWNNIADRPNDIVTKGMILAIANTANIALTANYTPVAGQLLSMKISQFANDTAYLTTFNEKDASVKSYAKTKEEVQLIVGSANFASKANLLVTMNIGQFTNDKGYLTSFTETDPLVQSYAKTKTEGQLSVSTANIALISNYATNAGQLVTMNVGQFINDKGYLTSFTETDPSVQSYAKTKTEGQLSVSTANIALTANYIAWTGIGQKPTEYVPVSGSAYYRSNSWVPDWAVVTGKPVSYNAITHSHSGIDILSKVSTAATADYATLADTAAKLATMNVGQFSNDKGYLTSFTETDPSVQSYAKTKTEGQLSVSTANVALISNYATNAGQLLTMNVGQFSNDKGYLTSFTETDPSVQGYAKTKTEAQLSVGTANVVISMNASGLMGAIAVNSAGNVGIGVTDPGAYRLKTSGGHISLGLPASAIWSETRTGGYATGDVIHLGNYLILDGSGPEGGNTLKFRTAIHGYYFAASDHPDYPGAFSVLDASGYSRMSISQARNGDVVFQSNGAGNVGIGLAVPSTKLDVAGTVSASALQVNGLSTFVQSGSSSQMYMKYNATTTGVFLGSNANSGFSVIRGNDNYGLMTVSNVGDITVPGNVSANAFIGNGSALTNLPTVNAALTANEALSMMSSGLRGAIQANVMSPYLSVFVSSAGNVGIGNATPPYKLTVEGTIAAREMLVSQATWADFVFGSDYKLMPLNELERFVKQYHHLPGMQTEAEAKKNGASVSEMNSKFLQKIEELTLYIIDMQRQIDELKKTR